MGKNTAGLQSKEKSVFQGMVCCTGPSFWRSCVTSRKASAQTIPITPSRAKVARHLKVTSKSASSGESRAGPRAGPSVISANTKPRCAGTICLEAAVVEGP